jgi:hypothetical protein
MSPYPMDLSPSERLIDRRHPKVVTFWDLDLERVPDDPEITIYQPLPP